LLLQSNSNSLSADISADIEFDCNNNHRMRDKDYSDEHKHFSQCKMQVVTVWHCAWGHVQPTGQAFELGSAARWPPC